MENHNQRLIQSNQIQTYLSHVIVLLSCTEPPGLSQPLPSPPLVETQLVIAMLSGCLCSVLMSLDWLTSLRWRWWWRKTNTKLPEQSQPDTAAGGGLSRSKLCSFKVVNNASKLGEQQVLSALINQKVYCHHTKSLWSSSLELLSARELYLQALKLGHVLWSHSLWPLVLGNYIKFTADNTNCFSIFLRNRFSVFVL